MSHHRHARRHAKLLLTAVLLATLVAAAVNTRVDPWRVTGSPWADPRLDPYRDISAMTRTGKAGLVTSRDDWQAAIFGSSRVISTMDPQAAGWQGMRVVNLGMPGAFLHENLAMAGYFLDHQHAGLLVFGVDPGDLTSPLDTRPMSDFMASPLHEGGVVDRRLRYVVGISTLEASLETLKLKSRNQPGEYNAFGLRDRTLRGGGQAVGAGNGPRQLQFIRDRFIDDARVARRTEEDRLDPSKTGKLESLMRRCRESGVRLVLFLQPNHVLLRARSGDLESGILPYETDRRALVDLASRVNQGDGGPLVEVWDFYGFHPYNTERVRPIDGQASELVHWRDLEHFTKDVGEGMLSRMMDWPQVPGALAEYGIRLHGGNLEDHLSNLRAAYHDYLRREATGDVRWKEELTGK